jgi:hypothetical protein
MNDSAAVGAAAGAPGRACGGRDGGVALHQAVVASVGRPKSQAGAFCSGLPTHGDLPVTLTRRSGRARHGKGRRSRAVAVLREGVRPRGGVNRPEADITTDNIAGGCHGPRGRLRLALADTRGAPELGPSTPAGIIATARRSAPPRQPRQTAGAISRAAAVASAAMLLATGGVRR